MSSWLDRTRISQSASTMPHDPFARHALYSLVAFATAASRLGAAEPVDFAHDVLPLLEALREVPHQRHVQGRAVSLDTREKLLEAGVAEPGHAADSAIIDRVTSDDPEYRMPPEGRRRSPPPRSTCSAAGSTPACRGRRASRFTQSGYEPPLEPRRPELPPAEAGVDNPIDRIVVAYWREHGVTPPPLLDDAAFIRRASLDLVGLLPTPDETSTPSSPTAIRTSAARSSRACSTTASPTPTTGSLLERPAAQRLRRHRLHRRRPQADHRLALPVAARQQAVRPVRPRADRPDARVGRLRQGHRVARPGERQPAARAAVFARTSARCSWAST